MPNTNTSKPEWGPRLLALRLRTGFQIFIALFATVIGIAIAIHDAIKSRSERKREKSREHRRSTP